MILGTNCVFHVFHQAGDQIVQEMEVGEHFRIEFNGEIDINSRGNGFGRVTRHNTRNGLEEASVEGNFINGLLEGKVK